MAHNRFLFLLAGFFLVGVSFASTIELYYSFPQPTIERAGKYERVTIPRSISYGEPGCPVLPIVQARVLLLPGEEVNRVDAIPEHKVFISGSYRIEPGQPQIPLSYSGDYEFFPPDSLVYNSATPYPGNLCQYVSTQKLCGYAIAHILLYPVEWVPQTGVLSYYPSMRLVVSTSSSPEQLQSTQRFLRESPRVSQRVRKSVDNPDQIGAYRTIQTGHLISSPLIELTDSCDYLIITSDMLKPYFQVLADFKTARGLRSQVISVEDVHATYPGDDEQERIRNLIIDGYTNWGVDWVLLGGDDEIIPHRGLHDAVNEHLPDTAYWYEDYDIASDLYYAALDGNWNEDGDEMWGEEEEADLYAEVFLGRMAVASDSEALHFINKTIAYQYAPVTEDCIEALMAGETLGWAVWGADYKDEVKDGSSNWGYTTVGFPAHFNVATLYDRDLDPAQWNKEDLIPLLNGGMHIVNGMGHGYVGLVMKLNNSDVDTRFTNDGVTAGYFIIHSQACYCNSFDDRDADGNYVGDAISEHLTRISNGAAAFVGNTRYGWGNFICTNGASQRYDRQFFDALFGEGLHHLGEVFQDSKEDNAPSVGIDAMRWSYYSLCLLGDPELSVWTRTPGELVVSFEDTLFTGLVDFRVEVTHGGAPVEGALVCISMDSTIYERDHTNFSGEAIFSIAPVETGELLVTVTEQNMFPYGGCALVFQGDARVQFHGSEIDDDTLGARDGNGYGIVNPAESTELSLWVRNFGGADANGVWGKLESSDSWAHVLVDSQDFGSIAQFDSAQSSAPYRFHVLEGCPDGHSIQFDLTVTDALDSIWISHFEMTVAAPLLGYISHSVHDITSSTPNGALDPGETAGLVVVLRNNGTGSANELQVTLTTRDPYVSILDSTADFADIHPDSLTGNENHPFIISAEPETPVHHLVHFGLRLRSNGHSDSTSLVLKIALGGDFLVWDPDPNSTSGPTMVTALEANGYVGDYTKALAEHRNHLSTYKAILVCLGMTPEVFELSPGENIDSLCRYLDRGGNLFMEGGNCWYGDTTSLHSYFRLLSEADGADDIDTVLGVDGTFTREMSFEYAGEKHSADRLLPLEGGWTVFANSSPSYVSGVAFRSGTYNTVASSFEFGGLLDGVPPSQKTHLADSLMKWFTREISHDVAVWSCDSPGILVPPGSSATPQASVKNLGKHVESFYFSCVIESSGIPVYSDSQSVIGLLPNSSRQVQFSEWSPEKEGTIYTLTLCTHLESDEEPNNDSYSTQVISFTPLLVIESPCPSAAPVLDGLIDTATEWNDAARIDVSNLLKKSESTPYLPGSVYLFVMNDHHRLYLGVDVRCDSLLDYMDGFSVITDDNYSGTFPPFPDSSEGTTTMWYYIQDWLYYQPMMSDSTFGPYAVSLDGASGTKSGKLQYELALPFADAPDNINASPGDTIGFGLIVGRLSPDSGFALCCGWWPQEALNLESPEEMGIIVLSRGTGIAEESIDSVMSFRLGQVFPNPAHGRAEVVYELPWDCDISLKVYNSNGQLVKTLLEGEEEIGIKKAIWDCTDSNGKEVATGIYFYRLVVEEPNLEITRKVVVLR